MLIVWPKTARTREGERRNPGEWITCISLGEDKHLKLGCNERDCASGSCAEEQGTGREAAITPERCHRLIHHLLPKPGKIQNAFKQHKHSEGKKKPRQANIGNVLMVGFFSVAVHPKK